MLRARGPLVVDSEGPRRLGQTVVRACCHAREYEGFCPTEGFLQIGVRFEETAEARLSSA